VHDDSLARELAREIRADEASRTRNQHPFDAWTDEIPASTRRVRHQDGREYNSVLMAGHGGASVAPRTSTLDQDGIERRAQLEAEHWWYRGRRRILIERIERLPLSERPRLLEVGCGSGELLPHLRRFGPVTGVDLNPDAAEYARDRGKGEVLVGTVESLPFGPREFELVTCLDVLEHVADDGLALAELRRVTAHGGLLLAAVPAYPALWSPHDVAAGHVRRYRRGELDATATRAGWSRVEETGFNMLLLPIAACIRLAARLRGAPPRSDLLATPRWLDGPLELPLRAEAAILRRGWRLPAGLSLLAVFENRSPGG